MNSKYAIFNKEDICVVDNMIIQDLLLKANNSRGTFRFCMHKSTKDSVQEMIIVHKKNRYIRPHKHPNKSVSYHLIMGKMKLYVFDDKGIVINNIIVDSENIDGGSIFRLCKDFYYMPYPITDIVFHETITGPFDETSSVVWAPWSPNEDSSIKEEFLNKGI